MLQVAVSIGILLTLGVTYPFDVETNSREDMDRLCLGLFGAPIVFSLIQMCLLIFIHKYDSPVVMQKKGEEAKLKEFYLKLYYP